MLRIGTCSSTDFLEPRQGDERGSTLFLLPPSPCLLLNLGNLGWPSYILEMHRVLPATLGFPVGFVMGKGYGDDHRIMGVGKAIANPKMLEAAVKDLETIAGQKAVKTKARKSISNFKLREGMPIGARVTLREERMWEFLDRFINITLPGIRDYRGVPTRLSGTGHYTMGLTDQLIFTEIE